jgi:hypothetical protein
MAHSGKKIFQSSYAAALAFLFVAGKKGAKQPQIVREWLKTRREGSANFTADQLWVELERVAPLLVQEARDLGYYGVQLVQPRQKADQTVFIWRPWHTNLTLNFKDQVVVVHGNTDEAEAFATALATLSEEGLEPKEQPPAQLRLFND